MLILDGLFHNTAWQVYLINSAIHTMSVTRMNQQKQIQSKQQINICTLPTPVIQPIPLYCLFLTAINNNSNKHERERARLREGKKKKREEKVIKIHVNFSQGNCFSFFQCRWQKATRCGIWWRQQGPCMWHTCCLWQRQTSLPISVSCAPRGGLHSPSG